MHGISALRFVGRPGSAALCDWKRRSSVSPWHLPALQKLLLWSSPEFYILCSLLDLHPPIVFPLLFLLPRLLPFILMFFLTSWCLHRELADVQTRDINSIYPLRTWGARTTSKKTKYHKYGGPGLLLTPCLTHYIYDVPTWWAWVAPLIYRCFFFF